MNLDVFLLAFFGFFTGLGTTFGAELARYVINKLRNGIEKKKLPIK